MKEKFLILLLIGVIALIGNWVGYDVPPSETWLGMLFIIFITFIGWGLSTYIPIRLPGVIWISLLALLITSPIFPGSAYITKITENINFMALATPILAYAGLSFGKDIQEFKKMGWKIVIISLVVYTGTFLFSTLLAEIMFRVKGSF